MDIKLAEGEMGDRGDMLLPDDELLDKLDEL